MNTTTTITLEKLKLNAKKVSNISYKFQYLPQDIIDLIIIDYCGSIILDLTKSSSQFINLIDSINFLLNWDSGYDPIKILRCNNIISSYTNIKHPFVSRYMPIYDTLIISGTHQHRHHAIFDCVGMFIQDQYSNYNQLTFLQQPCTILFMNINALFRYCGHGNYHITNDIHLLYTLYFSRLRHFSTTIQIRSNDQTYHHHQLIQNGTLYIIDESPKFGILWWNFTMEKIESEKYQIEKRILNTKQHFKQRMQILGRRFKNLDYAYE